jgi:hypothetical protein
MRAKDISRRDVRALLDRKAATAPIIANRIRATLRKKYCAASASLYLAEHAMIYSPGYPGLL